MADGITIHNVDRKDFYKELEAEFFEFSNRNMNFFQFFKAVIDNCKKDPKLGVAVANAALGQAAKTGGKLVTMNAAVALGMSMTILILARTGKIKR